MNEQIKQIEVFPEHIAFRPGEPVFVPTHQDILTSEPEEFCSKFTDVGANNLACAVGLPGTEDIDIPKYLALLDRMATAVKQWTEKNSRLFEINSNEFKNSKNVFHAFMLTHVLSRQFAIGYNPSRVNAAGEFDFSKDHGGDMGDVFIHGALGPRRTGTCGTLPVVAVPVGRRLGYPLYLVKIPRHLFFRWHEKEERFNVECTPKSGSCIYSDDYYANLPTNAGYDQIGWDQPLPSGHCWLDSLLPRLEMARFISSRVIELRRCRRYREVLEWIDALERFHGVGYADWRYEAEDALSGFRAAPITFLAAAPESLSPSTAGVDNSFHSTEVLRQSELLSLSTHSASFAPDSTTNGAWNIPYYSKQTPLHNPSSPNQVNSPDLPHRKMAPATSPSFLEPFTNAPVPMKRIPPVVSLPPVPSKSQKFSKLSGVGRALPTITSFAISRSNF